MQKRWMLGTLFWIQTLEARPLIVGVESINYLPYFTTNQQSEWSGCARDILDAFASSAKLDITYRPLPIKRLYENFYNDEIDFKFPDNEKWLHKEKHLHKISYSEPVLSYTDGTMVQPEYLNRGRERMKTLGFVLGFEPWTWMDDIKSNKIKKVEGPNFTSLVKSALLGHLDGIYANVKVIEHMLESKNSLVFDPGLPHTTDSYRLSSIHQSEILKLFGKFLSEHKKEVDSIKAKWQLQDELFQNRKGG